MFSYLLYLFTFAVTPLICVLVIIIDVGDWCSFSETPRQSAVLCRISPRYSFHKLTLSTIQSFQWVTQFSADGLQTGNLPILMFNFVSLTASRRTRHSFYWQLISRDLWKSFCQLFIDKLSSIICWLTNIITTYAEIFWLVSCVNHFHCVNNVFVSFWCLL